MTWANHRDKLNQLYTPDVSAKDIGRYVERWEFGFLGVLKPSALSGLNFRVNRF